MSNRGPNCAVPRDGRLRTLAISKDAYSLGLAMQCELGQGPEALQTSSGLSALPSIGSAGAPEGVSKGPPEEANGSTKRLRVLMVEDEPADVELVLRAL